MNLTRHMFLTATAIISVMIAAPIGALAQELTKLTFIQEWPTPDALWIPWIIGSKKGFYKDEGLELDIVVPPTVADTMKFLGTGRAQVAFTTVMDIIFARSEEAPVTAISRYGLENNWGIFSAEGMPLTITELKGKRIGIYNDAWTKAQLSMMLADVNLTLNDIETVAAADDTVPLLLQHRVDAITGITNAEGTGLKTTGNQTASFLPATEHGVPNTPIFMLAGNDTWLREHPNQVKAFLRATAKSIGYATKHPQEAIDAFTEKYGKAYDAAFITQQWTDTIPLFGKIDNDLLVNQEGDWATLLDALKKFDVVKNPQAPSTYFTNAYLRD